MTDERKQRGGKREGAGRKPLPFARVGVKAWLTPEDVEYARSLGGGNVSAGLRRALAEHRAAATERT